VEVIFTLGFGHYYLKEPLARSELIGLLTVAAGVVFALLGSF
jgi:drug/metabolite transporter (DMT)-like permease